MEIGREDDPWDQTLQYTETEGRHLHLKGQRLINAKPHFIAAIINAKEALTKAFLLLVVLFIVSFWKVSCKPL